MHSAVCHAVNKASTRTSVHQDPVLCQNTAELISPPDSPHITVFSELITATNSKSITSNGT